MRGGSPLGLPRKRGADTQGAGRALRPAFAASSAAAGAAPLPPGYVVVSCGGRIGRVPASRLPQGVRCAPTGHDAETLELFRFVVAPLLRRMTPWVHAVFAAPKLEVLGADYHSGWQRFGGVCLNTSPEWPDIILDSSNGAHYFLEMSFHEAFHAAWWRFSDSDAKALEDWLDCGHWMPSGYYDDIEERGARAFAAYAQGRYHGLPAAPGASPVHVVFEKLWSGGFADAVCRAEAPWTNERRWLSRPRYVWGGDRYAPALLRAANAVVKLVGLGTFKDGRLA